MQQALEPMHLKLTEVGSDLTGKTGMTSIRAMLAGDRAPPRLAPSREKRCPHEPGTIAQAVTGPWRAAPLWAWQQAVDQPAVSAQP